MRYEVQLVATSDSTSHANPGPSYVVLVIAISTIQGQPPSRVRLAGGCSAPVSKMKAHQATEDWSLILGKKRVELGMLEC